MIKIQIKQKSQQQSIRSYFIQQRLLQTQKYFVSTLNKLLTQLNMRQLLKKSTSVISQLNNPLIPSKSINYQYSAIPPNMIINKGVQYQFKLRSILKLQQLYDYIIQNGQDIKKYGKTILLQFLNQYPMQSFRRSRDQVNKQKRNAKYELRFKIYMFLNQLEDLNFYQLNMKYSIFKKILTYIGPDPRIKQTADKCQVQLIHRLKTSKLHLTDIMNWLYMLPLNYPDQHSSLAFDLLQVQFQDPQVRQFLKHQRSLPALIKRICQKNWGQLRKYKNIIKFLTYQATLIQQQNVQQIIITLQRVVSMKLHLVAQKQIPKLVDQIMQRLNKQFQNLSKNKQALLKVFYTFKYLPINYNIQFFNKLHDHLKGVKQLPSHLLLYLPYNKLNQSQISYLQSKMFSSGRQDIAPKLIYTIYQPQYKDILTPFIVKQAYTNMLQIWKKDTNKGSLHFQPFIALIFRFNKLNNSIIEHSKLKQIFYKIAVRVESDSYQIFHSLSTTGIIAFFQLVHTYDVKINDSLASTRAQMYLKNRKQRQSALMYAAQLLNGIKVHFNASSSKSRYFLTMFIHQIVNNTQVPYSQKLQLLFVLQKTMRPQPKWLSYSNQLQKKIIKQDIRSFVQSYITYEYKTLKLTNFIFTKLYQRKVKFQIIIQLLSSINIKLITSLKGKLITPLKKYITEMNLQQFDISNNNLNALINSYRILFYYKNQITQFMEYFSIQLMELIYRKCKEGQYINGKQFASISSYVMEVLANYNIKKKTQIIQYIVSIIKTLRKKQGIYIKVYELDFLCNNQKFIQINNQVLQHHWLQILQTLRRTDRYQHHKDLYLYAIKLHCRQFIQLNQFDLRFFIDKCTQFIDSNYLNLTHIKQALGYDILNIQDEFIIQKMKLYLSSMVKLAFRKDRRKHNYFIYEYYLKFFSKIQSKQMITQICQKLLYQKLYPIQVSNIIPILNKNQIKNKKFITRILNIISLTDNYVTFQKTQVLSWLEKILYELPQNSSIINSLKYKIYQQINNKVATLKQQQKDLLDKQQRSIQDGFQVSDPNFDKNYKLFLQYLWSCLKYKNTKDATFKFICRYIYFSIDKIKVRLQNPQERKQLSKIKLYHVFKYIKQCGFFQVSQQKLQAAIRQKNILKEKIRKVRLLNKMEKQLAVMKIENCQKLQKKLSKITQLDYKFKAQLPSKNPKIPITVEYYIQEKDSKDSVVVKNKYIIHTIKKYHCTPQLDILQVQQSFPVYQKKQQSRQKTQSQRQIQKMQFKQQDILQIGQNQIQQEQPNQNDEDYDIQIAKLKGNYVTLQQTDLTQQLKPQKQFFTTKQKKQQKIIKPLFGSGSVSNKKKKQQQVKKEIVQFKTVLKLQPNSQNLFRNYNGYLKVQKSLIQLTTGLKCLIYDPDLDILFD